MNRAPEAAADVLEPGTRVVGDLHLDLSRPEQVEAFVAWLDGLGKCPQLVILGDLFEYWVGMAQADSEGGRRALGALRACSARGTRLDFLLGNRDFLLDGRFAAATGGRVHPAGLLGTTPRGERVLFLHGDELCTADRAYQRLRRVLRSGPLRFLAPRLPAGVTRAAARRLRRASRSAVAAKPAPEKAQSPSAAAAHLAAAGADVLVVGHAHRFRDERLDGGGRWIVVDGFGGPLDQILVDPDGTLVPGPSQAQYEPPPETVP